MSDIMNDPVLAKHFKAAGIEDDAPATGATTEGGVDGSANETAAPDAQAGTAAKTAVPVTPKGDGVQPDAATGDSNSGGVDGAKKQGKEAQGKGAPGPGDLLDAQGNVVAKAGPERRHYETLQTERQRYASLERKHNATQQELGTLRNRVQAYEQASTALGTSNPQETADAVRLMRDFNRAPVETLTKLLAEVKAAGYSIDGIGSAVDAAALSQMLDQRLPPAVNRQGPTAQQVEQQSAEEVTQFLGTYPDAAMHETALANIITRHPELALEDAYFKLKESVISQGYDWSQPLGPQVQARKAAAAVPPVIVPAPGAPLVGGRPLPTHQISERDPQLFAPDGDTTDDIIKQAMRESGIAIQ
jgi:hypothetical protein